MHWYPWYPQNPKCHMHCSGNSMCTTCRTKEWRSFPFQNIRDDHPFSAGLQSHPQEVYLVTTSRLKKDFLCIIRHCPLILFQSHQISAKTLYYPMRRFTIRCECTALQSSRFYANYRGLQTPACVTTNAGIIRSSFQQVFWIFFGRELNHTNQSFSLGSQSHP